MLDRVVGNFTIKWRAKNRNEKKILNARKKENEKQKVIVRFRTTENERQAEVLKPPVASRACSISIQTLSLKLKKA